MRVLLLLSPHENAISPYLSFLVPPLSLGVIARALDETDHDVQLCDLNAALRNLSSVQAKEELKFLYSKEQYLRALQAAGSGKPIELVDHLLSGMDIRGFDVVGISLGSEFSFLQIHLGFLIGAVLTKRFEKQVVFGGGNVGILYLFKEFFRDLWRVVLPMFPCIIKGPGEVPFLQLLNGSVESRLPGRVYMEGDDVSHRTESTPIVGSPRFEGLDMSLYETFLESGSDQQTIERNLALLYKWPLALAQLVTSVRRRLDGTDYDRKLVIPYVFNYGCPYRCAFCTQSGVTGKRTIVGDAARVVEDLVDLGNRWGSNYFHFSNNAFNNSPAFADRFCEKMVREGIRLHWSDCGRFNNMTEDRIAAMAEAGCRKITFGFETASVWLRRYIDKRIDLDQAEKVLEWCKKHGVWVDLEVIVGLPYETDGRFQETLDFLSRNRSRINDLAVNDYFVVPNSLIGLYPERYGVELIREYTTYERLLSANYEALLEERTIPTENFRIYRYNECAPHRGYRDIDGDTRRHRQALAGLWGDEYRDVVRRLASISELLGETEISPL